MSDTVVPDGWQCVALSDLLAEQSDLTYGVVQPGPATPGGVPILRVKDIRLGRIATEDLLLISSDVERQYERSRIQGGELLVTLVGTVGETAIASDEHRGWNTARAVATVRLPTSEDSRWVSYCLQSPEGQERIRSRVNTTVQTTLNLKDLREFPVLLPPVKERREVAGVLSALDDKIESNRRLRGVLTRISRLTLLSEVGEIVQTIGGENGRAEGLPLHGSDLRIVDTGFRNDPGQRSMTYLATADVSDNEYRVGECGSKEELPSRANMEPGFDRCWFARMKATPKWLWTPSAYSEEWDSLILSTGFLGVEASDSRLSPIVMTAIRTPEFQDTKDQLCNGTTMQSLNNDSAGQLVIRVPSDQAVLTRLSEDLRANLLLEHQLNRQSMRLIRLRETLLPELMSGRLRVKDAESMMVNV